MGKNILVKRGVVLQEINDYFVEFILALRHCANEFNHSYTITSANDGKHCKTSYHYKNTAWDVRLHDTPSSHWYVLQTALRAALPLYFDIIIECVDDPDNVHLHVEADLNKVGDWFLVGVDHAEGLS